jgi:hypothetical protein
MITSDIIKNFEIYVDDGTELSSSEELNLANKIYRDICNYRPWEWLKKVATGSIVANAITLPTDFAYMSSNNQSSDNNVSNENVTSPKAVFVGTDLTPIRIVNFSDRRQYKNQDVAYIDPTDSKIKFILTQTATTYEFDYIKVPVDLTLATSPIFPSQFHDIIYHGMATDDYMIQQFDKAKSYKLENEAKYTSILKDMSYANAQSNFN